MANIMQRERVINSHTSREFSIMGEGFLHNLKLLDPPREFEFGEEANRFYLQ